MIDDIELRLTRWKPSDDTELERDYIGHLIDVVANDVVSQDVMESYRRDSIINPQYIKRFVFDDIQKLNDGAATGSHSFEYYINLDFDVLPLPDDLGIVRVFTNSGQEIHDVSFFNYDNVKYFHYGAPSRDNLQRSRENRLLFLNGLSSSTIQRSKIVVQAIPTFDFYNDEDDLPLPDDLVNVILDMVEEKLLRALGIESDLHNDGKDIED